MRGAAEETVAVRQDFQGSGAAHHFAALDLPPDDGDDELGPRHASVLHDPFALGQGKELGHRHAIEIIETRPIVAGRSGAGAAEAVAGIGWVTAGTELPKASAGLRSGRLRATLDPSSLRATAMFLPPVVKGMDRLTWKVEGNCQQTRVTTGLAGLLSNFPGSEYGSI